MEEEVVKEEKDDSTRAGKPKRRGFREQTPLQRALGLLTRREHSRQDLLRKLVSRGIPMLDAEAAVKRLADEGWQDDRRFAESLIRYRAGNGYGPRWILAELATHGLDQTVIAAAMDSFDGDWAEVANDLVRRRFGPGGFLGDLERRRKVTELLLRRGFDGSSVQRAVRDQAQD